MSSFGRPKDCINHCGSIIYFDANSTVGHPAPNKWLPLEYKEGRKTDTFHDCPNKKQNGSLAATVVAATSTKPKKLDLDNLAMIKVIAAALNEYIAIKEGKEG